MAIAKPATGAPAQPTLEAPYLSPGLIVAAALGLAAAAGGLIAIDSTKGLALVLAVCFVPIAFANLPVGIALWLPTTFLTAVGNLDMVCQGGAIVIAFAWLGRLRYRREPLPRAVIAQGFVAAAFVLWLALSLAWAREPSPAFHALTPWIASAVLFVVVASSDLDERGVRMVLGAYVIGVVLSMGVGLLVGAQVHTEVSSAAYQQGRFQGAAGDPNYLAAVTVPAIALAAGLVASSRPGPGQLAMTATIPLLVIGLVATESRGGLLSALVAMLLSVLISKRGRIWLLGTISLVVGTAAIWFASTPAAWERVTSTADKGNGRDSLWKVAWEMSGDHAPFGVGLGNFPVASPEYARSSGALEYVTFIAERSHVVHNVYLQLLAEVGVLGVGLFVLLAAMSFAACLRAVRLFEGAGALGMATLARAAAVALAGGLAASFFISNGSDFQLWVLLAFGPALLVAASTSAARKPAPQLPG